jgi:hypothetical protein
MLHPFDDGFDALRQVVMAGLPVIAAGNGDSGLEAAVRHAAAVAGRSGDLRILHLDGFPTGHHRVRPESRRLDPGSLPSSGVPLPTFAGSDGKAPRRLVRGMLSSVDDGLAAVPPLDIAEVEDGRHIVVVHAGVRLVPGSRDQSVGEVIVHWLVHRARRAAAKRRREGPFVFLDRLDPQPYASEPGCTYWRDHSGQAEIDAISGDGGAIPATRLSLTDRLAWRAALARYRAGLPVAASGGHIAISDGERLVLLRRLPHEKGNRPEGEVHASVTVHETGPDGWTAGCSMRGMAFISDAEAERALAEVAAVAWSSGISALSDRNWSFGITSGLSMTVDRTPLHRLLSGVPDLAALAGHPKVAPFLARADPPLDDAVSRMENGQAILAAIRGRARRRDFAVTWPALAGLLMRPDVRKAADLGSPMVPVLSSILSVRPSTVRRLVGCHALPRLCAIEPENATYGRRAVGEILDAFGHGHLPAQGDAAEWAAFTRILDLLFPFHGRARVRQVPAELTRDLAVLIPGRTWAERVAPTAGLRPREVLDAGDLVSGFATWLGDVGYRGERRSDAALILLSRGRSLVQLVQASREWHADARLRDAGGSLPPDARWPVPFAPADLGDGWTATALDSLAALSEEGSRHADAAGLRGLDHCVLSYAEACLTGASVVLSLRADDGQGPRRVSTVELVRDAKGSWAIGGVPFRLAQHRGLRNRPPGEEAKARLETLAMRLGAGTVPVDKAALAPREMPERAAGGGWDRRVLHGAWRRLLPPRIAALTIEALIDEAEAAVALDPMATAA